MEKNKLTREHSLVTRSRIIITPHLHAISLVLFPSRSHCGSVGLIRFELDLGLIYVDLLQLWAVKHNVVFSLRSLKHILQDNRLFQCKNFVGLVHLSFMNVFFIVFVKLQLNAAC